jgi:membrane-bound serine protease (ClpP class)
MMFFHKRRAARRRRKASLFFTLLGLLLSLPVFSSEKQVNVATYDGIINPVAAEFISAAIAEATRDRAEALVIKLDTPGGLDTSMRMIIKEINASEVPIVVYVAPPGGRAASAGVFITMDAHIAAMAPGTNIGAAHPVAMGGGEMDKEMKAKVENDAAAYIKSIAEKRGRNAKWAEEAVRKSVSVPEKEAVTLKIVDMVAEDVPSLLKQIDGREVVTGSGKHILRTKDATVKEVSMGMRLKILNALSDPNIAYILMLLGIYGLIFELSNPGAIFPGVVGAICLILAFYAFQTLPINYAGLLLLLLGLILFIAEIKVPSYGLLTIGGIISMILGSLMLMKTDAPFFRISWAVIIPSVATTALFFMFVVGMALRAQRGKPLTGAEGLVGMTVTAQTDIAPHGRVLLQGELWEAVSDEVIKEGENAVVKAVDGLRLVVKRSNR